MNKRTLTKKKTRQHLLETARIEFFNSGFLNTSTKDIAQKAGVAHGTLFLHFETKEKLILKVYDAELKKVTADLYDQLAQSPTLESLLDIYFDWLEENENFYAIIARELPYYPGKLRRKIFPREAAIRNYFRNAIESGIEAGKYKDVDLTMALNFFFGTINFFLSLKPAFVTQDSVINEKRSGIKETFLTFLGN